MVSIEILVVGSGGSLTMVLLMLITECGEEDSGIDKKRIPSSRASTPFASRVSTPITSRVSTPVSSGVSTPVAGNLIWMG